MTSRSHATPTSLADLFDTAIQFYRRHFVPLSLRVIPLFITATVLYHLVSLFILPVWAFLVVMPVTFGFAMTVVVAHLSTRLSLLGGGDHLPLRFSVQSFLALLLLFALQALLLMVPWVLFSFMDDALRESHKNDYVAMIGSGDTPYEEASIWLGLQFACLYPIAIFIIMCCYRLLVPTVLFERVGPLRGLYRSIQRARKTLGHILLTTTFVAILYGIILIALHILWQTVLAGVVQAPPRFELLLHDLVLAIGCAFIVPLAATINVFLYASIGTD